jgi:hypothetical protein
MISALAMSKLAIVPFYLVPQVSVWANRTITLNSLTTKITKNTKDPDIFILNLRALRVLRGENLPFYFGCGSAALC